MSATLDVQEKSAEADAPVFGPPDPPRPVCLPADRLERAIVDYLADNGPVMTFTDLSRMLWVLSLDPLRVVQAGASYYNIQAALLHLVGTRWVELRAAKDPKQFWLRAGVARFRHDSPDSFVGEQAVVNARLIALATALLPRLKEAPDGFQPVLLNASDQKHPPTAETRQKVLANLVNLGGTWGRAAFDEALGFSVRVLDYTVRWFEAEGLLVRIYANGPNKPPDLVLLPGGCRAFIAIMKGEPYLPPSGLSLTHPSLDDDRAAQIIGWLEDGEWHRLKVPELAARIDVGPATVNILLPKMVRAGQVERTGTGPAVRQIRATAAGIAWRLEYLAKCPPTQEADG